jgi:hypothetical protein
MASAASKLGSNIPASPPPKEKPYVKIVLQDTDRIPPTGQFFGVNGKFYQLRAGEEAMVPIGIIDVLKNAKELHPIKDGMNRVVGQRERLRFPYTVVYDEVEA